jgi:putative ABC transport system permease protein
MFRNYFKIAIRNLKKNKLHTFINIIGLSVAFACNIILLIIAYHEFSFDKFHTNNERLFKVYNYRITNEGEKRSSSMGYPQSTMLRNEVPAVESISPFMHGGSGVSYNSKEHDLDVRLVRDDFFSMFSFPIISGNNKSPLADLGNVVITKRVKKLVFNDVDPIGKSMRVRVAGDWKQFVVAAVIEEAPTNSTLKFDVLLRIENRSEYPQYKDEWNYTNHAIYVKLRDHFTQQQAEQQMRAAIEKRFASEITKMKQSGIKPNQAGELFTMKLLPIAEAHFNSEVGDQSGFSKAYLYTLVIISLFVLAIACFNFVNLNVARIFTRSREVGMRKCLGADKKQIFIQLWGESAILCCIALLIGIISAVSILPSVLDGKLDLKLMYQPYSILAIIFGTALVSFIAGGYPAALMSKLNTVNILKGKVALKKPGLFRNAIIVFQFTTACLLICCTIVIYKQFQHMRSAPLGLKQEHVISIPIQNVEKGQSILNQLRMRLANQPSVTSLTGSDINIGVGNDGSTSKSSSGFDYKGKVIMTNMITVDYDYFKTLGIKFMQGRDFDKAAVVDTINSVIVTESMAKLFTEKEALGLTYLPDSAAPAKTIIGIIPDIHTYSLHEEISPITFTLSKAQQDVQYIFIKSNSNNPKQTMDMIQSVYKDLEPDKIFKGSFMEENTQRWYTKEKQLSTMFTIASSIAITLSCLGLFAIVLLIIEQRTKEIGVRKVLGASVPSITFLLSKEFMRLVAVAVVIAIPLAWYFMNQWLQDFPYRTQLNWWMFAIGGMAAIFIAIVTVGFHSIKAAMSNPVKSINVER